MLVVTAVFHIHAAQYSRHEPHVAAKLLKHGQWDQAVELLIN